MYRVNDNGTAAGESSDDPTGRPVVWTPEPVVLQDALGAPAAGRALALNNSGLIAGSVAGAAVV